MRLRNFQADIALKGRRIPREVGRAARCTIAPRSMTSASSVSERASSVCCSTSRAAIPWSFIFFSDVGQLLDDDRGQAFERLVEQQQGGIGHQRAGHGEHLLLAAGELVAEILPSLLATAGRAHRRGEVPRPGPRGDGEVLLDAERRKDLALLRHPAQAEPRARVGRKAGDILAFPSDVPR